eukprot:Gb_17797 [translate_table: standard]
MKAGWKGEEGQRKRTVFLINLAMIVETADSALLPGVYMEISKELNLSPTDLGSLTLFRHLVQCISFPLAAYLAIRHNRASVIAIGALAWSMATISVGLSTTYSQIAVSRALNGIGLAVVLPAIQSMVADSTDEENRGLAFGWLQMMGNMGAILGNVCSVMLATETVLGISGWRIAFYLVGFISMLLSLSVFVFAVDQLFESRKRISNGIQSNESSVWLDTKKMVADVKTVVRLPTFRIIVGQGIIGSFPSASLAFGSMWLELIGYSHKMTAFLHGIYSLARSMGGLFGGKMGDILSKNLPNAGRIILAQISAGSGVFTAAILLLAIPGRPVNGGLFHGLSFLAMGFLNSWCAPATNNPIFAEIVAEKSRTTIYAIDRTLESFMASFAPPLVGLLSQHVYGYVPVSAKRSRPDVAGKSALLPNLDYTDRRNGASLAKALYTAMGIPYAICCLIYSFLYWTYSRDRDASRVQYELMVQSQEGNEHIELGELDGKLNGES